MSVFLASARASAALEVVHDVCIARSDLGDINRYGCSLTTVRAYQDNR